MKMRVKLVVATMGICASFLIGGQSLAADTTVKETKGKISFTVDENEEGVILRPDETGGREVIQLPGQGSSGKGPLRLQFVPNFDFGEIKGITSEAKTYEANLLTYTGAGGGVIAPFIQVTNHSGVNSKWYVTASATPFKNANSHVLTGAYVSLVGSTLTSNLNIDTTGAANLAEKQEGAMIPTTGGTVTVLSAKTADAETNGKQLSNVFHDGYTKEGSYVGGKTPGVTLVKPDGITARATEYTSTITWTLNDGL